MSVNLRERWVERRFLDETRDWLVPRCFRDLRRALIRAAQQFCFFGYYGDASAAEKAGYMPFSRRTAEADYEGPLTRAAAQHRSVTCMRPARVLGE